MFVINYRQNIVRVSTNFMYLLLLPTVSDIKQKGRLKGRSFSFFVFISGPLNIKVKFMSDLATTKKEARGCH